MPLFRRRRSSKLTVDPTLGNTTARQALEATGTGWESLAMILRGTSFDERELAVSVVSELPGWPEWVDDWVAAQPDDPLAWTVRGATSVAWAWEVRGGGMDVDEASWLEFQRRLATAEDSLTKAVALDPADPTPRLFRLIAGRGLELEAPALRRRFDDVVALDPLHRAAHNHMIQALAPKWGGSNEEMFAFARAASANAPEGSAVHAVIAEAHIERWLWTLVGERDADAASQYWTGPEVGDELTAVVERSLLSPAYVTTARYPWDHQLFAFGFWHTSRYDLAARMFDRVGDVVSEFPWVFEGDPAEVFHAVRSEVTGGR